MLGEDVNTFTLSLYKDTYMTWDRYSHKSKVFWHRKYLNVPKCNYCDKPVHVNKFCHKKIKVKNQGNNKNKDNNNKCNYWKITNQEENYCYNIKQSDK